MPSNRIVPAAIRAEVLGDRQGGMLGYNASQLVGAYRNIATASLMSAVPASLRD